MVEFELLERDGLARIGRLRTPHGPIETPALLPVLHPDPARQPASPKDLRRFRVPAVITSAYITWRTPPLRERAEREGIHGLLGFDGPVMTDSGAFQQHAYGTVEVGPAEILDFQERIGSDIATVLDVFTEPEATRADAESALAATLDRLREARSRRTGLLAGPVQGGPYPDLRFRSAAAASELADVLAVGGVVPLFEQYRFRELAGAIAAARPGLAPERPVHLFGTGHPVVFAFAALFGVDLFDSSAYHKFARRGDLLFPEGTVALESVREPICPCALCAESPLAEVARWPAEAREGHLARHNLLQSLGEIARVRQAIRDGTLWELAERRATAHPALASGLSAATALPATFLATEPESRRAFRETAPTSLDRPAAARFRRHLAEFAADRAPALSLPRLPLRPEFLRRIPASDRSGRTIWWQAPTPFGETPVELLELYPVGPFLGRAEFDARPRSRSPGEVAAETRAASDVDAEWDRDWTDAWTVRQVEAILTWQYGPAVARSLGPGLRGERSRRTGRLRTIAHGNEPAFVVGTSGYAHPTFRGGERLRAAAPLGRHRVVVADDAVEFVRAGRSLFSAFVASADPALVPGEGALLVDRDDGLLAVGRLVLAPHEMGRFRRGMAVRVTAHARRPVPPDEAEGVDVVRVPADPPEPLKRREP